MTISAVDGCLTFYVELYRASERIIPIPFSAADYADAG